MDGKKMDIEIFPYRVLGSDTTEKLLNDIESLEDAVLLQKRIELWGEGLLYFDYKRLKIAVVRTYTGTNFLESHRLNSKYGFVAPWMDCYIPEYEKSSNPAVVLNPDPTSVVEAKSE